MTLRQRREVEVRDLVLFAFPAEHNPIGDPADHAALHADQDEYSTILARALVICARTPFVLGLVIGDSVVSMQDPEHQGDKEHVQGQAAVLQWLLVPEEEDEKAKFEEAVAWYVSFGTIAFRLQAEIMLPGRKSDAKVPDAFHWDDQLGGRELE